jgi:hypothetical protein
MEGAAYQISGQLKASKMHSEPNDTVGGMVRFGYQYSEDSIKIENGDRPLQVVAWIR